MKLAVVGLGKLGSPFAALLASKGHHVTGIDFNEGLVEKINDRKSPFLEPQLQELLDIKGLSLQATSDYEPAVTEADATFIIVPTPSAEKGQFTNRYVLRALESIGKALKKREGYHLVVVTSTVMPGSMDGEIQDTLESASGRKVGEELGLCYSPEFIALGSVVHNMLYPDMVLIGESDQKAGDLLESIYRSFCENHPPVQRMNCVNAELTKLSLNTYVTTKISYANMLAGVCEKLPGSDVNVVTDAIGLDSRIGRKYLKAAVPFGGPCFPRDNVAFRSMSHDLGAPVDLAEATQTINDYQIDRLEEIVKGHANGKKVGILGLSYKPGTDVIEESPGIHLANRLKQRGYTVTVYDPEAMEGAKRVLEEGITCATSLMGCLEQCELAIIMTNWPEFQEIDPHQTGCCTHIIDCWRVLDQKAFTNGCLVSYLGQGQKTKSLASV
ncbi:MAG: UDP-glucose/GDP-mannose dehydrogenase family protein [Chlamydiales bacterium]|nr:UDP-glucose/GDP-mannose dehydrogenase family protein [Chlamydiales bacterium]